MEPPKIFFGGSIFFLWSCCKKILSLAYAQPDPDLFTTISQAGYSHRASPEDSFVSSVTFVFISHLKNVILPKAVSPRRARAPGPNGDTGTV